MVWLFRGWVGTVASRYTTCSQIFACSAVVGITRLELADVAQTSQSKYLLWHFHLRIVSFDCWSNYCSLVDWEAACWPCCCNDHLIDTYLGGTMIQWPLYPLAPAFHFIYLLEEGRLFAWQKCVLRSDYIQNELRTWTVNLIPPQPAIVGVIDNVGYSIKLWALLFNYIVNWSETIWEPWSNNGVGIRKIRKKTNLFWEIFGTAILTQLFGHLYRIILTHHLIVMHV